MAEVVTFVPQGATSFYFDGTALFKLFHPQLGSEMVDSVLSQADSTPVLATSLTLMEAIWLFAQGVRSGDIAKARADEGLRMMHEHSQAFIAEGRLRLIEPAAAIFGAGRQVADSLSASSEPPDLADSLHVAAAVSVRPRFPTFVTARAERARLAVKLGLTVVRL